jgi:hypothetical protein
LRTHAPHEVIEQQRLEIFRPPPREIAANL